jgi:hypothetical protein
MKGGKGYRLARNLQLLGFRTKSGRIWEKFVSLARVGSKLMALTYERPMSPVQTPFWPLSCIWTVIHAIQVASLLFEIPMY